MTSQNFRRKHSRNSFDDEYDKPVCISSDGNVTSSSSVSYNSTKSPVLQRRISNHASRRLPTLSINNTTTSTGSSSTTTAAAPQRFNVLPPPAAQLPFSPEVVQASKRQRGSGYFVQQEHALTVSDAHCYRPIVEEGGLVDELEFTDDSSDDEIKTDNSVDRSSVVSNRLPLSEMVSLSRNWNAEYQKVSDSGLPFYGSALTNISMEFADAALTYGKIIISEYHLAVHHKTIKPASLGGMAGGDKYVVHGIVFKFAVDTMISQDPPVWLYGGSKPNDGAAAKAASNELEARDRWVTQSYQNDDLDMKMCFPLLCLVTYKGFRLIAMSLLPISNSTLVYGSCDGGTTVVSTDPQAKQCVEATAQRLNLRPHGVGKHNVRIAGPGDIEVHKGTDGRYYMIDVSRTMPCEAPPPRSDPASELHQARYIFHQLLRPALVETNPVPLNSDAFSSFNDFDPNKQRDNRHVKEATERLYDEVIPAFAADLEMRYGSDHRPHSTDMNDDNDLFHHVSGELRTNSQRQAPDQLPVTPQSAMNAPNSDTMSMRSPFPTQRPITRLPHRFYSEDSSIFFKVREQLQSLSAWRLHKAGINCRHLGRIRAHLRSSTLRRCVLSVIVARCLKQMLDVRMRQFMSEYSVPSDEPFKRLACDFFNSVFDYRSLQERTDIWKTCLKEEINIRFPHALDEQERTIAYDLRGSVSMSIVFVMALELSDMRLGQNAETHLLAVARGQTTGTFRLRDIDVLEIGSKAKLSVLAHFGRAVHLLTEGLQIDATGDIEQTRRVMSCAHAAAVTAWRRALDDRWQRTFLALIEVELAGLVRDFAESAVLFDSGMEAFSQIWQVWPQKFVHRFWMLTMQRFIAKCRSPNRQGEHVARSLSSFWTTRIRAARLDVTEPLEVESASARAFVDKVSTLLEIGLTMANQRAGPADSLSSSSSTSSSVRYAGSGTVGSSLASMTFTVPPPRPANDDGADELANRHFHRDELHNRHLNRVNEAFLDEHGTESTSLKRQESVTSIQFTDTTDNDADDLMKDH